MVSLWKSTVRQVWLEKPIYDHKIVFLEGRFDSTVARAKK